MIHSSRSSFISILLKIPVKTKAPAAIIIFLALLTPRLWGDDRKEYINMDGKALAVEAGAVVCGPYTVSPTSRTVDKAGGIRNVTVHGGESGCSWAATSNAS